MAKFYITVTDESLVVPVIRQEHIIEANSLSEAIRAVEIVWTVDGKLDPEFIISGSAIPLTN